MPLTPTGSDAVWKQLKQSTKIVYFNVVKKSLGGAKRENFLSLLPQIKFS